MQIGIQILVILAVPTLFQVVLLAIKQKKRHEEFRERLVHLERKLDS